MRSNLDRWDTCHVAHFYCSIICLGISLTESFRARKKFVFTRIRTKRKSARHKSQLDMHLHFSLFRGLYHHQFTGKYASFFRPVKSHSDGFINYLKYQINLYASKTSFWLFFGISIEILTRFSRF